MVKVVNLEETPFIDLRNRKQKQFILPSYGMLTMPTNEFQIQYKIYDNFLKFDESKLTSKSNDRKIIRQLLGKLDYLEKNQLSDFQLTHKIVNPMIKNKTIIQNNVKFGDPEAAVVGYSMLKYTPSTEFNYDDLMEIAEKTRHPLLLTYMQGYLRMMCSPSPQKIKKADDLLNEALKYGLPNAFMWKGLVEHTINNNGIKAYEMFKNAQRLGFKPMVYKQLGQVFMIPGLKGIVPNMKVADKYFNKAKELGMDIREAKQEQYRYYLMMIEGAKLQSIQNEKNIISTLSTRSFHLANFIETKLVEKESNQKNFSSLTTNNGYNQESFQLFNRQKVFHVVFSPLMGFPGRHFLVKDEDGNIEYVSLYNWQHVPIEKLRLLHKIGTKVILKQYVKKLANSNGLPMFRVDDPNGIEIEEGTQESRQRWKITDSEFRMFARNLFERNLLDKAEVIYNYLVMKGASELEVVLSNIGLIKQKQNKLEEAVEFYLKSLSVKKYEKSLCRLFYIYLHRKEFQKAKQMIPQIDTETLKSEMLDALKKAEEKEKSTFDFKKNYTNEKKLQHFIKKFKVDVFSQCMDETNVLKNIRQGRFLLNILRERIERVLNCEQYSEEQYLTEIQRVYDSIDNKLLGKEDIKIFFQVCKIIYQECFNEQKFFYSFKVCSLSQIEFIDPIKFQQNRTESFFFEICYCFSVRQNYAECRLEQMGLDLMKKEKYEEAENTFRFADKFVVPFKVRVAECLFLQQKYEETVSYCETVIKELLQFPLTDSLKFLVSLVLCELKSLIKLKHFEKAIHKGEQYLERIKRDNPKFEYDDFDFSMKDLFQSFMASSKFKSESSLEQKSNKHLKSGKHFIRQVYCELSLACVLSKDLQKAKHFLSLGKVEKTKQLIEEENQLFYRCRLLEVLIEKEESVPRTLTLIQKIRAEVKKEKKLNNKESFTKFLEKERLSLHIKTQNVENIVQQCENIVDIDAVNLLFVKEKLFHFLYSEPFCCAKVFTLVQKSRNMSVLLSDLIKIVNIALSNKNEKEENESLRKIIEENNKLFTKEEDENKSLDDLSSEQQQHEELKEDYSDQEYLKWNYQKEDSLSRISETTTLDSLEDDSFANQICRFANQNIILFIVIFAQEMKNQLQVSEFRKFVAASDHMCTRKENSTGIKIRGENLRLKIRGSARLIGRMITNEDNPKVKICFFDKKEGHDDYKRRNKK